MVRLLITFIFISWCIANSGLVWTALESEGFGANLQHYSPLIDEQIAKQWSLPASWKLDAQLVFGTPTGQAGEKTFLPLEERFKVFGK